MILKKANLDGSKQVFTRAVERYQKRYDVVLGKSRSQQRREERRRNSKEALKMNAEQVKRHIEKMHEPDGLYWALLAIFREQPYRWGNKISWGDFPYQNPPNFNQGVCYE